jgi:ATP-dependent protease HslVU (ClpYQ) peptidase subunit
MTVIAWDGKTLAADKLGDAGGLRRTITKIHRFENGLFGSSGLGSHAAHMFDWIKSGAHPEDVPAFQLTDEYQSVMVVRNDGTVWLYGQSAYPFRIEDPFHAIGSGRDFAIAAMYLGFGAQHAVHVASQFDTGCGGGIDTLEL